MKWNFLYEITAASRTPDYHPQIPFLSVLNWICWTPPPKQNSWVRHWHQMQTLLSSERSVHMLLWDRRHTNVKRNPRASAIINTGTARSWYSATVCLPKFVVGNFCSRTLMGALSFLRCFLKKMKCSNVGMRDTFTELSRNNIFHFPYYVAAVPFFSALPAAHSAHVFVDDRS